MEHYIKTGHFSLEKTLESGQCFRWRRLRAGLYRGTAAGHTVTVRQEPEGITLIGAEKDETDFWRDYFDLDTDYGAITERFRADKVLYEAAKAGEGIRILRQEPFETLISFIISQNNNIPRITGIISRLCESFGDCIDKSAGIYSFPTARTLAGLTEDDLSPLRAGFRNRYILDAARRTDSGAVDLDAVREMPLDRGREYLKTITGVGDKVADCVLLYGFHKLDAFPADVWIKRITAEHYPDGLPPCMDGYRGIAQQYLFEYFRKKTLEKV